VSVFFVVFLGILAAYDLWDRTIGFDDKVRVSAPDIEVIGRIDFNLVDESGKNLPGDIHAEIVCLDGYKYLLLGRHPISGITQVFKWDEEKQRTVPISCSDFVPIDLHEDH
jgi:hypothetical protein